MPKLVYVTSNDHKLAEMQAIVGHEIERVDLDIPEIQSMDVRAVVKAKAETAFQFVQAPVVVEDVSFEVRAWNGFPGPLIKWVNQTITPAGIAQLMRQTKDRYVEAIALLDLYDGHEHLLFEGRLAGTIADEARGESGFGFDVVFVPMGETRTFGEMTTEEKNKISHRALALRKLKDWVNKE